MRDAFADELLKLAREDKRIVLLSGDIGNRMFDSFKAEFPRRFFNCGVAEANMVTVAAGMAMSGLIPVVYTIASFLVYRPFEQIRIDIAYHQLPVILVGVGGGLAYASNGPTHHALEDLAALRTIPELTLVAASDAWEVRVALRQLVEAGIPAYLRIGKKREPLVYQGTPEGWKLGKMLALLDSPEARITLLTQGTILPEVLEAAKRMQDRGFPVRVINFHTLRPLDQSGLRAVVARTEFLFTIEEHSIEGALGTAVAEFVAEDSDMRLAVFKRLGMPAIFFKRTTNQFDAREQGGLTAELLSETIWTAIHE